MLEKNVKKGKKITHLQVRDHMFTDIGEFNHY